MNTKLSGAQLVVVPITRVGKNYFPVVQYLRDRVIKFIDFYQAQYLPGIAGNVGLASTQNMYLSIKNQQGNEYLHYEMPLQRFDYTETLGVRQPIFTKISLPDCYIDCQDSTQVGKMAAFIFYYDLPEYSKRNDANTLITDAVSIPMVTATRYNQFPDIDRLTGKRFRRILLGFPTVTPDLQTGLTAAQLGNCFLTLRKGSYNVVENLPLPILWQLGMLTQTEWANIIFDFQNSFITIGGAGTIPNVNTDYIGKHVFLNMQYEAK